ncbi:MAG: hypothetical protein LBV29_02995 [Azoarcus sp.]|jgi:hypothetical protein|nr:hypothetical protein [Azoarcus sp.]
MFGLTHLDAMPVIYGVIMFLGLWSMWHKLVTLNIRGFIIEASVFTLVFWLHGGSMTGGFTAMIAALLFGTFFGRAKA